MNSTKKTVVGKNEISLFFSRPFNWLSENLPEAKLNLNARHNFAFSCDSLKKDIEKVKWKSCKKSIETKIVCVSNFNSALEGGVLIGFDELDDLKLPLQMVKLSCEFNVKFDLEIADDGVCFNLVCVEPDIATVKINANIAIRSNSGAIKLVKHDIFVINDFNESEWVKLNERFMSSFYRDCLEKELFTAAIGFLQVNPVRYKAEIMHDITENNYKLIQESLAKEVVSGGGMWTGRCSRLLQVAYEMNKYIQASNEGLATSIHDFKAFLELDCLHCMMIAKGGNSDICAKPVADLRDYLFSVPGFDNDYGCKALSQSRKTYEQHGFLLMQINRVINEISHTSRWVD